MKLQKIFKIMLVLFIGMAVTSNTTFEQEWSEEQKEVWKNVEKSWDMYAKQDLEGNLAYFHDDYSGWWDRNALPVNKAFVRKNAVHEFKTFKVLIYNIQPVAINIHGNVAIVQFYWSNVIKDAEGKEQNGSGRWTDILMKEGDNWFLIGDHGGSSATN
jgi:ketosteroid isomerase-like protein